jgi:hypothetical protein
MTHQELCPIVRLLSRTALSNIPERPSGHHHPQERHTDRSSPSPNQTPYPARFCAPPPWLFLHAPSVYATTSNAASSAGVVLLNALWVIGALTTSGRALRLGPAFVVMTDLAAGAEVTIELCPTEDDDPASWPFGKANDWASAYVLNFLCLFPKNPTTCAWHSSL